MSRPTYSFRLTFSDCAGWTACQGVVSDAGRFKCVPDREEGRRGGAGLLFFLYDLATLALPRTCAARHARPRGTLSSGQSEDSMIRTLAVALLVSAPVVLAAQDPLLTDGDKYTLVLENERVRVLEYRDEPGDKTSMHAHRAFVLQGLVGTLVSPSRGVLLFFPYLQLVPWGLPALRDDPRLRRGGTPGTPTSTCTTPPCAGRSGRAGYSACCARPASFLRDAWPGQGWSRSA